MPDIFGDNVFHEYAMDCFDQKGKESSYLHLLNGKWIETKQLFFKYDEEVYMSDMMIINKKTTDLKEECLKDTFLEKFLLTKVDPCIRIKYIFAAKHNRFWEQAVKCGFDSWVHGQLGGRRYFFNPKFIKNRNFTEYFTLKEWKENIDIIELDNMEKIYSLKNTGFTITAAHELIREAGFFLKAYEESGYAKGFVGLMNTLVKRSDNSKSEYNDYLHMRKTLPEILRHPEKLLHDYPIVIPGKKIHLYHQRLVNTLEYLELEKQREAIKGYEKKYKALLEEPDKHGLQYDYDNKEYYIFPAPSLFSLLEEGKFLHHCVGSYYDLVGDGITTIYFLRKKEDIYVPFFTVEVKDNTVVQVYTFYDQPIKRDTPEYEFVVEWMCKYKLKSGFWAK